MSSGAIWFCCILVGVAIHFATIYTSERVDFILWRLSAICFLSAGIVSTGGIVGQLTDGAVTWTTQVISEASRLAFGDYSAGAEIAGVIFIIPCAMWVGGMAPQKWVRWKLIDKLAFAGPILPSLVASCPGVAGDVLRAVIGTAAQLGLALVTAAVGS